MDPIAGNFNGVKGLAQGSRFTRMLCWALVVFGERFGKIRAPIHSARDAFPVAVAVAQVDGNCLFVFAQGLTDLEGKGAVQLEGAPLELVLFGTSKFLLPPWEDPVC